VPFLFSCSGENAVSFKPSGYFIHAGTLKIFSVDALYDFSLLRINDELAILVLCVSEKAVMVDGDLSLLVTVLKTELHVLAERLAFLLGKTCHYCDQYLAFGVHRVYGFFFEVDRDVLVLELSDVLQAVEGIAGKT
jgi:hypothetical protein